VELGICHLPRTVKSNCTPNFVTRNNNWDIYGELLKLSAEHTSLLDQFRVAYRETCHIWKTFKTKCGTHLFLANLEWPTAKRAIYGKLLKLTAEHTSLLGQFSVSHREIIKEPFMENF
jgi:hypothetical protein